MNTVLVKAEAVGVKLASQHVNSLDLFLPEVMRHGKGNSPFAFGEGLAEGALDYQVIWDKCVLQLFLGSGDGARCIGTCRVPQ